MASRCLVLPPATPTELLSHVISHYRYPTTLLIGTSKQLFLESLTQEIQFQPQPRPQQGHDTVDSNLTAHDGGEEADREPPPQPPHKLLRPSLMQIAVSRHIRTVFVPTVVHLRAYLAIFSKEDSKTPAPPNYRLPTTDRHQPVLLMYGFLELHRATSEWSAQGIANSASALVEAAARNDFRAVVVDPSGGGGYDTLDGMMQETLPILNGTAMKEDGAWSGRTVDIQRVLGRWFEIHAEIGKKTVCT